MKLGNCFYIGGLARLICVVKRQSGYLKTHFHGLAKKMV